MGLKIRLLSSFVLFSFAAGAQITGNSGNSPILRLVTSTVGPISAAVGSNGPTQTVEAYNIGGGTLNVSALSSVPWIATTIGNARQCTTTSAASSCVPIGILLNTSSLAAGTQTGTINVTAPNTIDAPQTITVTVQVGGGVPPSVDMYVAPGTARDFNFATNSPISGSSKTQDGSNWLSLALDGTGSFRFVLPYRIHLAPSADMAPGNYTGTVVTTGSSLPADNRTIAVTMRVTTQPIAQASPSQVNFRLAQGAPPTAVGVSLTNLGQGTLTLGTVTSTTTGGSWLTTAASGNTAVLTFDPGSLAPANYTGSVTLPSNAVNGSITVPVNFQVVAKGAPVINFQGVQDNGTFVPGDTVARGDVMVVKGEQLSFSPLTVGKAPPLDKQIGGAQVLVNDVPVPMYYSSYGQLAFQMPLDAPGIARVAVVRDGQTSNTVSVNVADRAPRLLRIGVGDYGAVVNASDGSLPMPPGSLPPPYITHPAHPGDVLTFYSIGLGPTNPVVPIGEPAPATEPFARITTPLLVNFGGSIGGMLVEPAFAGLTPTFAGLYQINVQIPDNVGKGTVVVTVAFNDAVSNPVRIEIQ